MQSVVLPRLHLFEIHDLDLFPNQCRDFVTDALAFMWQNKSIVPFRKQSPAEAVGCYLLDKFLLSLGRLPHSL